MYNQRLRRILAIAIVMAFALSFALPAAAADYVEATQSSKVYQTPSSTANVIGTLTKGGVAEKLGTSGTSWTAISFGGKTGYVLSANVKASTGTSSQQPKVTASGSTGGTLMYTTTSVSIYSGPGSKYAVVGSLSKGEAVNGMDLVSGWRLIEWNGGVAYVNDGYLQGGSAPAAVASGNWVKAKSPVNVRKGPGTKYAVIGELSKNETVEKLGVSGKWTKINYYGTTAYVSSSYVTAASTPSSSSGSSASSSTSTSTYNRLYAIRKTSIYAGPGTGYGRVGELAAGDYLYYSGSTTGSWYKVQYGNHASAYVNSYDVQFQNSTGVTSSYVAGMVYATATTPLHASMRTSSSVVGYLYRGDSAPRAGIYSNGWTGVMYNGREYYARTSMLTTGPVSTGTSSGMYAVNAYWYATSTNVPCYKYEGSSSVVGYLYRGERVYVASANATWAECIINGQSVYVRAGLLSSSGSGYDPYYGYNSPYYGGYIYDDYYYYSGYGGYYNSNYYRSGYATTRNATEMYERSSGGTIMQDANGVDIEIPRNTRVEIVRVPTSGSRVLVSWRVGGKTYEGYVYEDDLRY